MNASLYFDYNATTPADPAVVDAMLPWFHQQFGNAGSQHSWGWQAAEAVNIAREQLATLIGAEKEELIFTSGATESINLALRGVADAYASKGNHIISCATEHKAVLDTLDQLSKKGTSVTLLPVDANGSIDLQQLEASITGNTILIALMYANNETGVIHPVDAIASIARKHKVIFFCDATQAVGKIPVQVLQDGMDLMAFSAHKLYGPKGVGALYVRRKNPRVRLTTQITGGGHERGMRSGTLNIPGIVGFGTAAAICREQMFHEQARLEPLRNKLEQALIEKAGAIVNGGNTRRLAHVSHLQFPVVNGSSLLTRLIATIAVSSGSACSSAQTTPSHVLKAMGMNDGAVKSSIRFSLGRWTTAEAVETAIQHTIKVVQQLLAEEAGIV
ncbi:MAG TPA: IscS subfamily cysteine desulfurase [Lacibacter sp.]|nr:IscS subfamily cysteine desulfurase [Lacibacter sp.]